MPNLEQAEAALHALEGHTHAAETASARKFRAAARAKEDAGDEDAVKRHTEDFVRFEKDEKAALKAHAESGITVRHIDIAAQKVLDARGEAHTETNILPPDHGMRTVAASNALAQAQSALVHASDAAKAAAQARIDDAQRALDDAESLDAADKAAHMTEGHKRTMAALTKGAQQ